MFQTSRCLFSIVASHCLRWNPALPLSIAHLLMEDDVYEGYFIPKGTVVLPNVWLILHDEERYPGPLKFWPERYADSKTNMERRINPEPLVAFGFGRRICPGRWLAIDAVWITVATVAASFNISRWLDEKGNPIDLSAQSARAPQMQHYPTFSCCCCVGQANRRRCLVSYL
ncbi:hypothetical protein AcV5_010187 [Taiwanofungus camphoratus]|nr:hypothetical protein AcV5_010187 [Antrodia cinnamomea]